MAGFPGRWLGSLCFLISFTPSTFLRQAGPGERDACCRGTPALRPLPPQALKKRAEASDCGWGRGMPGIAVGNLWPGCS